MEQREFVVEQETAGQRIDRFLSGEDTGLSRSALQALVADGHVLCNGRLVAKSLKLKAGDTIAGDPRRKAHRGRAAGHPAGNRL